MNPEQKNPEPMNIDRTGRAASRQQVETKSALSRAVAELADEGYAVLHVFCTDADLDGLRGAATQLIADRLRGSELPALLWIRVQPCEFSLFDPDLLHRARQVSQLYFGEPCHDFGVRLFVKPALAGAAVPWHQDEGYSDPAIDQQQINVWVPLESVREASGCLRVVPRSHHGPLLPHRKAAMPLTLEIDAPASAAPKSIEIDGGDAALLDRRILHSSFPNRSSRERIAIVFICRGEPKAREFPLEAPWLDSLKTFANASTNIACAERTK